MSTDPSSLIVGLIALIGSVHYTLTHDMLNDVIEVHELLKKEPQTIDGTIINKCKHIFTFFAVSNGCVMFMFSLFISFALCMLIKCWLVLVAVSLFSWMVWLYISYHILGDLRRIEASILPRLFGGKGNAKGGGETSVARWICVRMRENLKRIGKKILRCLFPQGGDEAEKDKMRVPLWIPTLVLIHGIGLVIGFACCYFLPLIRQQFVQNSAFFPIASVVTFLAWFFSFWLRPLTQLFEVKDSLKVRGGRADGDSC